MANRLGDETSPYLLQHADNPVDWYPWGDEALTRARVEDRPILLSVGYSACHWCHVMAHESFEDPDTATLMNELFVCIKVDREERPDIDSVYMKAVQAITGRGGWPMTVFLTPAGAPFHAGTYFPPTDRGGIPAFARVLRAVADAYKLRRSDVRAAGDDVVRAVAPAPEVPGVARADHVAEATARLLADVDERDGGFGAAPKFPHPGAVEFLIERWHATSEPDLWTAASLTLDRMARGGIHDHLGGGFHRYSVDRRWAVPHFEKMLYDNAQLVRVYLHAFQVSGRARWRRIVERTIDYVLRELRTQEGCFAASQDADSDGAEGRHFLWTEADVEVALGVRDAQLATLVFGIGSDDVDGKSVLRIVRPLDVVAAELGQDPDEFAREVDRIRSQLFEHRVRRPAPPRDDTVIVGWNALMLGALAEAGAALDRADWIEAAELCAQVVVRNLRIDGRLRHSGRAGVAGGDAFLDDRALLADALVTLYEATGTAGYLDTALSLTEEALALHHDGELGFCDTAGDAECLVVRPRTLDDHPLPSGQSTMCLVLLRLATLAGRSEWEALARATIGGVAEVVARLPLALSAMASALGRSLAPQQQVVVVGDPADPNVRAMVRTLHVRYEPGRVIAWGSPARVALFDGRDVTGAARAYVCDDFVCHLPFETAADLAACLDDRRSEPALRVLDRQSPVGHTH